MRWTVELRSEECTDKQAAWQAVFELLSILAILLCLSLSARAQSAEAESDETQADEETAREILVSIPDRKLALIEDGEVIRVYPVAVGAAETPTPDGEFEIVNRLVSPTYYHPGTVIEPGTDNPLGTRWMGLSQKGFGIHGTNVPSSIGKAASHGCVRMKQEDLEELFEIVEVGDVVVVRSERDEEVASVFGTGAAVARAEVAEAMTHDDGNTGEN